MSIVVNVPLVITANPAVPAKDLKELPVRYLTDVMRGALAIARPEDLHEREADRVARQIMAMPESWSSTGLKQGDIVTSVVRTHKGKTIVINYDMQLPRPYDKTIRVTIRSRTSRCGRCPACAAASHCPTWAEHCAAYRSPPPRPAPSA